MEAFSHKIRSYLNSIILLLIHLYLNCSYLNTVWQIKNFFSSNNFVVLCFKGFNPITQLNLLNLFYSHTLLIHLLLHLYVERIFDIDPQSSFDLLKQSFYSFILQIELEYSQRYEEKIVWATDWKKTNFLNLKD